MSTIVEADSEGAVRLPPDLLPGATPHARYRVEAKNGQVVLSAEEIPEPFWKRATPEHWAVDLREWIASHSQGPGLPDSAAKRDSIYK